MNWVRCRSCASWYDGDRATYCSVCGTSSPGDLVRPVASPPPVVSSARPAAPRKDELARDLVARAAPDYYFLPPGERPEVEVEAARDGMIATWSIMLGCPLALVGLFSLYPSLHNIVYFPLTGIFTFVCLCAFVPSQTGKRGACLLYFGSALILILGWFVVAFFACVHSVPIFK